MTAEWGSNEGLNVEAYELPLYSKWHYSNLVDLHHADMLADGDVRRKCGRTSYDLLFLEGHCLHAAVACRMFLADTDGSKSSGCRPRKFAKTLEVVRQ